MRKNSTEKENYKKEKKNLKNQKKSAKKSKKQIKNEQIIEKEYYFGHKEDDNIWTSFLTETMFAHRGLWNKECPENSLAAFTNAMKNGYGIELDVNTIEDGTPVIFHDSKMSRMTGKDKYIQNLSKEELEHIKLLDSEEKVPTLEEVLKLVKGKVPLLIEIKNQEKVGPLERRVLDLLKNYKGEYAIQSFNPYTLRWFYEHAPKIWRGQLASYFKGEKLSIFKKLILRKLGMKKFTAHNFVSYDISNLPNRFTKKLEVPLLSWTIKNQDNYYKALQYSDNVIFEGFEPKI